MIEWSKTGIFVLVYMCYFLFAVNYELEKEYNIAYSE